MAEPILIYDPIYGSSFFSEKNRIADIVNQILAVPADEEIEIRLNTPGGVVDDGMAIVSNLSAHKNKVNMKVDGLAASMGAWMLAYADYAEASDVSRIMIHKAYYSGFREITEEIQTNLDNMNRNQKNAFLKRGVDKDLLDEIFSKDNDKNYWFTAKEAKKVGLIDKVTKTGRMAIAAVDLDEEINKMTSMYPFWNKNNINYSDLNNKGVSIMKDLFNKEAVNKLGADLESITNTVNELKNGVQEEIKAAIEEPMAQIKAITDSIKEIKDSLTKTEEVAQTAEVADKGATEANQKLEVMEAKAEETIKTANKALKTVNEMVEKLQATVTTFNPGKSVTVNASVAEVTEEEDINKVNADRNKELNSLENTMYAKKKEV